MTERPRILFVEDDDAIREALAASLRSAGYDVMAVPDGGALEEQLEHGRPALVVLDWMLPGRSGPQLAQVVRARSSAGLVMLTARDQVVDRLHGFSVGVDDYIVKPFSTEEVVARIRAVLRRLGAVAATIVVDDLVVDPEAGFAARAGERLALTATEFRLLCFLAENRGRVQSPAQILTQVWGYGDYADNLVQVHVSALRRKLEAGGRPRLLHTERGLGYVLRAPAVGTTSDDAA